MIKLIEWKRPCSSHLYGITLIEWQRLSLLPPVLDKIDIVEEIKLHPPVLVNIDGVEEIKSSPICTG